ncbi:MAG TPA: SUMF1/EgtB/PvdO family nonheme iron enzyme, partial [Planctomycetota bacterium]|nr:SUMF1/EgtB/PvdO family nonheme iron enzyme [Planctomycetota bacterium]
LVSLEGGRTQVGIEPKDVQELLDADPSLLPRVSSVDAETPRHTVNLAPFHLMVTEVTNEQYREFVKATGSRPPQLWGNEAIEAGKTEFFANPDNRQAKFDRKDYWLKNWEGKEWSVAREDLLTPVVFVDYADAEAYCSWAGLRLPTEDELQSATRGNTTNPYPWGTEVAPAKYAVTSELTGLNGPLPVGWIPAGATSQGIQDLIGNVWEWTTSPYDPYPGWKSRVYKVGRGKSQSEKESSPNWNGDHRVCATGSFELPLTADRCTIRRGTQRDQQTLGVGFRAAASQNPILDRAQSLFDKQVRLSSARADGVSFDIERAFGWLRWDSRASEFSEADVQVMLKSLKRVKPENKQYKVPEGYRVITGFHSIVFTPTMEMGSTTDKDMQRASLGQPIQLGFLSFTQDMLSPALPAGTYIVAYRHGGDMPEPSAEDKDKRSKGKKKGEEEEYQPPAWVAQIDLKKDNLLYFDVKTGELAAHVEGQDSPSVASTDPKGALTAITKKEKGVGADGKPAFVQVPWLSISGAIAANSRLKGRAFEYAFEIQPSAGFVDQDWRR